jgi:hypothetical protein
VLDGLRERAAAARSGSNRAWRRRRSCLLRQAQAFPGRGGSRARDARGCPWRHDTKEIPLSPISKRIVLMVAALGLVVGSVAATTPAHATTPPNIRCAVAKRKAAIKELRAIDACFAKHAPDAPDPTCIAGAEQKLQKEFLRIEAQGGCSPATGDEPGVDRIVNQCEAGLVRFLPGACLAGGEPCSTTTPCCSLRCIGRIGQDAVCTD